LALAIVSGVTAVVTWTMATQDDARDGKKNYLAHFLVLHRRPTSSDIFKAIAGFSENPKSSLSLKASWTNVEYFCLTVTCSHLNSTTRKSSQLWYEGKDFSVLHFNGYKFSTDRVKSDIRQLVLTVEAWDTKPANVFLTKESNLVLGDFGFALPCRLTRSPSTSDAVLSWYLRRTTWPAPPRNRTASAQHKGAT
jgi:hypothetical protein